jgi:hypothetical protein
LPSFQCPSFDLTKCVIQCPPNDREETSGGEPPTLPQALFLLPVKRADDTHIPRGDNAFHEAEEKALSVETTPACYGCGQHTNQCPDADYASCYSSDVEPLESKCHGVETG